MDLITISNSKITNLQRKVEVVGLNRQIKDQYITLECIVWTYDSTGKQINTTELSPYLVIAKAININLVDPTTGIYVDETFVGAVGEFDFLNSMGSQAIKQDDLIIQYVTRNDSLGKFDI